MGNLDIIESKLIVKKYFTFISAYQREGGGQNLNSISIIYYTLQKTKLQIFQNVLII